APNQVRSNFESAAAVQAAQRITEAKAGAEAPAVAENVRPKTANTVTVKARRTVQGVPTSCLHTITMRDDYGDGWNGGFIDVYVDGDLLLSGVTLAGGAGPETVTFAAATGQTVTTVWTGGDFPSEASYCITDVIGLQLGCDGLDG